MKSRRRPSTAGYGSNHYEEHPLDINAVRLSADARTVALDIPALAQPGRYQLKFDLVSEGIDWFESCGSPTTTTSLVVK